MLVVIVGNVTVDEVKQKLKAFTSIPQGSYSPAIVPPIAPPTAPRVVVMDRPQSPTNYVYAVFQDQRRERPTTGPWRSD